MRIRFKDDCWIWTGEDNGKGYGKASIHGKKHYAHRLSYELFVGPILAGFEIDHLCRNPSCVNPAHLEAVNHRVNVLRGVGSTSANARKTECKHGHAFDEANTYITPSGTRNCRRCKADRERERQKRIRDAGVATQQEQPSTIGHSAEPT